MGFEVATIDGRHGRLSFYRDDEFVGRSLAEYGEYSEEECLVFQKCLRPGQTVVEVGANIGAHTVPIAKLVGETGRVFAFEPCAEIAQLLAANLEQNYVRSWCHVLVMAAGDAQRRVYVPTLGELGHKNFGRIEIPAGDAIINSTPMETIDSFDLDKLHFLKIDAEGSELAVIKGARKSIERHRPIIYCENDREEKSAALVAELVDLKYRLYWHRPPLFSPLNAKLNQKNVFGNIVSLMMVCVPEERGIEVVGMDEVADIRDDDDMFNREITRYLRYVEINPDDLNARGMAAHLCGMMRRNEQCEALIAENLQRDPGHVPTLIVQGMRTLQAGKWKEGWPAYELRYQQRKLREFGGHRKHEVPKWNGEETDAPVLIWNEQGFGDTIMFSRFVKWARMLAPNLTVEVPPELYELFEQSGYVRLTRAGRRLPRYDLHCSIPSLPATLSVGKAEMHMVGPYLFADTNMIDKWREKKMPKIGICNVGSPRSERPFTRDLPASFVEGVGRKFGPFLNLAQEGQFESFADTAAAIANLDLVITVDTSIAHLAGAMAKPVWLLLSYDPDWRWGLEGSHTIWYPSMRIYRQPKFRDWASVMRDVEASLDARISTIN